MLSLKKKKKEERSVKKKRKISQAASRVVLSVSRPWSREIMWLFWDAAVMWLHSKAFVGNMTQSQCTPTAASNSAQCISLQHTHSKAITDFRAMASTNQGFFIPCCSKFRGSSLIFHWVSLHDYLPQRHLPGYCIYSVSVLLPDRYVSQTLPYSLTLYLAKEHQPC